MKNKRGLSSKRAQVTVFIIIAIVIVAAVIAFFLLKDKFIVATIPRELAPVVTYFDSCVEQKTLAAADLAGIQAGYIELPEFEPGTGYAPFSSQLDFLGFGVPYWYYLSPNGEIKEQLPSKRNIENQISNYLERELAYCDLAHFLAQGYEIDVGNYKVSTSIKDTKIDVDVKTNLVISKGDTTASVSSRQVSVQSKLGKFYSISRNIYDTEKSDAFIEAYAIDVLRLYAPVTGVEVSCSPLVWNAQEVADELQDAMSANLGALKVKGADYKLNDKYDKYFVIDEVTSSENVAFVYDREWPYRIEIWPSENGIMMASPIGLEQGLGVLGFCYVPYHFVYDYYFPVVVQVYDEDEMFQFPIAIIIDKSVPRNSLDASSFEEAEPELCNYKNTPVRVYTYDLDLRSVEAYVSYECFDTECMIGKTAIKGGDAVLIEDFPQCYNGYVIASAEGYATKRQLLSTNSETTADILLDKLYELELDVRVSGKPASNFALVAFNKDDGTARTVAWPEQKSVELSEGYYNVSVQVYGSSSIVIPATSTKKCIDVPRSGVLGFFGSTKEECFDMEFPEQKLENILSAGGNSAEYFLDSKLASANKIVIDVPKLPTITSIDQIQENYELAEVQRLNVII